MNVYQSTDIEEIKSFMVLPEVWDYNADDYCESGNFIPLTGYGLFWLVARDSENKHVGLGFVHAHNGNTAFVHISVHPDHRGEGLSIAKELFSWVLENTEFRKFQTEVPEYNKVAYNFAKKVGFDYEGNFKESMLKDGELIDVHQLGITRNKLENGLCQQQL